MNNLVILMLAIFVVNSEAIDIFKNTQITKKDNKPDWWENAVVYQIYVRSFRDSDNDGVGDLKGIIEKIDHFVDLKVDAIWLTPIYKSPMVDNGYDVSDYRAIDEIFGTMDDFKELLDEYHKVGIKVVMDFVPNHTSDKHEWFNKSVAKEPGYEDYYIWRGPKFDENGTRSPPNNWLSAFNYSAWQWNDQRQEYYYHFFFSAQPDLNFRNEKVHQEMKVEPSRILVDLCGPLLLDPQCAYIPISISQHVEAFRAKTGRWSGTLCKLIKDVMKYWLDMGVDGFRGDALPHTYEDAELRDEPVDPDSRLTPIQYDYLKHPYTLDVNESFELVYDWRDYMDDYNKNNGGDTRVFMSECPTALDQIYYYYGNGKRLGAHFSFNFDLLGLNKTSTAKDIFDKIDPWFDDRFSKYTKNWQTGNHDNPRVASQVGVNHVDAYNMLLTILGGVTVTYMGEEIGQENGEDTGAQMIDFRDIERTPFQWDTTVNAGFNDGAKPWLPVSQKYLQTNLADQKNKTYSHYRVYKEMVQLKKKLVNSGYNYLGYGYDENEKAFYVSRSNGDSDFYNFIFNIGIEECTPNVTSFTVVVQSVNVTYASENTLVLQPGDSVILKSQEPLVVCEVCFVYV